MRVVILGAGYAGLTVTRRLERVLPDDVELVLVDDTGSHLVRHELHRVIRRPELTETISIPLDRIARSANVREGRVSGIDPAEKTVTFDDEETLSYDLCAICLGAETAYYDRSDVAEHSISLETVDDARAIRTKAMTAIGGSAVVGGGGLTGIQVAGELAALSDESELDLTVTLVEQDTQLAPAFDETFAAAIERELERHGVTVESDVAVESASEEAVELSDGRTLDADLFVWAGGIQGSAALGGKRQRSGDDLTVADGTFVVGDAGEIIDASGTAVPASAQTAVQEARVVARNMRKLIEAEPGDTAVSTETEIGGSPTADDQSVESDRGEDPIADAVSEVIAAEDGDQVDASDDTGDIDAAGVDTEFDRYEMDVPGWVVSVGDGAVAQVGTVVINGEPARLTKALIGAGHLGSIGAIEEASELVAEELGWPTVAGSVPVGSDTLSKLPTDPSTPGTIQYPLANLLGAIASSYPGEETVDLTPITGELDPRRPGSFLRLFQRSVVDGISLLLDTSGFARKSDGDSSDNETAVHIDVEADTDERTGDVTDTDGEERGEEDVGTTDEAGEDGEATADDDEDSEPT